MASTYVNDLRLNEMATGDASGSWGTITNTNLELIGEAFGYGTETIGNADTTITMADGASDAARSFYLKITSSADLTTTRVITLAPNTVSKVWMIENATSGSQIITIKQGTGATINIPNGHVKMVATDGAGSGGAVLDLLTDLNVATNLFVKNAGTGDGSTANIYLQTAEADIAADDVIGKINFQAPNEGTGTDAILVSAAIQAISEGDFSSSSNATSLNFMTGASEAATTKMTLSSAGNLTVTGIVDVTDTTDASDATGDTGALRTEGGASIAKKLYVGTDLDVDGTTNLDVVDIDGAVDMASTLQVDGAITSSAGATITTADNTDTLTLTSTDADANIGPNLRLYRNSSSPADSDTIGVIDFEGRNDNSQDIIAARINVLVDDVSDGTEDATLFINTMLAGTVSSRIKMTPTETVLNDDSKDLDFRVETNSVTDALFVDGGNNNVQIGTGADFVTNTAGTSNLRLGVNAGDAIASGGNYNVFVGDGSGTVNTIGNTNAALGYQALAANVSGDRSTAVGYQALAVQNNGTSTYDANNTAIGYQAMASMSSGLRNVAIGSGALDLEDTGSRSVAIGFSALSSQNADTSNYNVAVGYDAGAAISLGIQNTIVGAQAGDLLDEADRNVAIGYQALTADHKGDRTVAIGAFALSGQDFTSVTSTNNVAVGYESGGGLTTGASSTLIGSNSGVYISTADNSTFVGFKAGQGITGTRLTGNNNVAVGKNSGLLLQGAAADNTVVGTESGDAITTGTRTVALGYKAGSGITTGDSNVAIGWQALLTEDAHSNNVAVGASALQTQNAGAHAYNTALGFEAGKLLTTGTLNTIVGGSAGAANTFIASAVTLLGYNSGNAITSAGADGLTAIGKDACELVTSTCATAVGANALASLISGSGNTAVGQDSLTATTATSNTAVGTFSGLSNTSGTNNVFLGNSSGKFSTTGAQNTFLGSAAGQGITGTKLTGNNNVAVGYKSGLLLQGAATLNTFVGVDSGVAVTTGTTNTFIGALAGDATTTAGSNTFVGNHAGGGTVDGNSNTFVGINTGDNNQSGSGNAIVGANADCAATDGSYANGLGNGLSCVAGFTTVGESGSDIRAAHGNTTWNTVSDQRYKKDIVNSTAGLSFINDLTPRTFKYKNLGELPETFNAYKADSTDVFKNSNTNHGFIAQEVKAAIDAHSELKDGFAMWGERPDGGQEIGEAALIPILTKAVQELSTALDAALARIASLEG